jgi:hypothetical protein
MEEDEGAFESELHSAVDDLAVTHQNIFVLIGADGPKFWVPVSFTVTEFCILEFSEFLVPAQRVAVILGESSERILNWSDAPTWGR